MAPLTRSQGGSIKAIIGWPYYRRSGNGSIRVASNTFDKIRAVCDFYRVSRKEMLLSRRGNENLPRDVSVYLVCRLCRMTLPHVGREFGVENYSTVSSIVQRVTSRIASDKRLSKEVDMVVKKVPKSQKRT